MKGEHILDAVLELSPAIRHVALHGVVGEPLIRERNGTATPGAPLENERWDELVVNPALLELARRRGDVDAGGLDYLLVRYGRFFNLLLPLEGGHLSVTLEPTIDPLPLLPLVRARLHDAGLAPRARG